MFADRNPGWAFTLSRLRWLRRVNLILFYSGLVALLPVALGSVIVGSEGAFTVALSVGWPCTGIFVFNKYFVLPFLKCPRCGNPFFQPRGCLGFISNYNPHERKCMHCQLDMRAGRNGEES